ncbi:TetR/AcrR family transcriptional regulator [Microbacterium sp. ASV49]|uniref:TetR-like C-terminal domain-containing protein n=1 Tax=Microbacterium candidum TaxID=3041922 RepID=A0ABT7MUN3_9MICO|nr:TetR-like C-terminal domain-containing protein [Microbacterium sp. ASV49]MDL9978164.1 TetR-like C-terminal domain-containing protein [Microbacterium sp. ASV49]
MPTPERTNREAIVAAATGILEREGLDALTMQAVAAAVGVRAPSLYKRVRSRNDVIRLVMEGVAEDLGNALDTAVRGIPDPRERALALLDATRAFAHARPNAYSLLFARLPDDALADPEVLAGTIAAVLSVSTDLVGEEDALAGARTLTAWVHGFVTMELAGRFRMGSDLDDAFAYGARHIADALARA